MVNSKTDALLDLQKGSAADLPGLHEYGFSVIEGYLESKIQRGQTASQARTKLDELELAVRDAGLPSDFASSFNEIRQLLTTAESGPLWQEVSPYHFRSRRSSSTNGLRSRALSAARGDETPRGSRESSTVRIAETQTAVLTALKTAANDEEAYRLLHTYAQRKMLIKKDAYWVAYKLELIEKDVKGDDQFPDVGPIFVAVRRDLNLPPSPIFRAAEQTRTFYLPPPTASYDVPPTGPRPPSELSYEPEAPPPYLARTRSTVEDGTTQAVDLSASEEQQLAQERAPLAT